MGRPPKPLEQREKTGRSKGRDSGGRPLPEVVVELPQASGVPEVPGTLRTADRATECPFLPRDAGEDDEADGPPGCDICARELAVLAWTSLWTNGGSWLSLQRDGRILERLCRAYDEEAHLQRALHEDGPWVAGQRGGLVAHPAVTMLRVLQDRITKWEGLCGFNPSDGGRLGVKVGRVGEKSTLEQLLERRAAGRGAPTRRAQRPAARKRAAKSD
ncbi:P27 family phage terminase small subunit [Cellulomonas sp. APG4]|uniref:P27 family phage terminase small subunit n=1 Tax=Cellulomonas sp. APG4 TaxID=1538656 RepID=UPI00137B83FC|nr:P27 family phage terminase small subunit [Cellulomonas sp. APG4]